LKRVRVRQHVNPLSKQHLVSIALPDWSAVYQNPKQPLHLDLGCARGRFILQMAKLHPEINFLGVEIRETLVKEALQSRNDLQLTNLHYLPGNINYSANELLFSLPVGVLGWITVQFPDPWFKNKHIKRRMLQGELIDSLVEYLSKDGIFFIQSDVLEVAIEMKHHLQENPHLRLLNQDWSASSPFAIATEREIGVLNKGELIYRATFQKQ
jgi:tRNA (guanine-N7-)-methyltransferase